MGGDGLSLESLDELDAVATEWDEVADRQSLYPWLRPGWAQAWRDAFARPGECRVLAARRENRLTGVLTLEARRQGLGSPTNEHTPMWDCAADDDASAVLLASAVFERSPRMVKLSFLPAGGRTAQAFARAARAAGYRLIERPLMEAPYITLDGSWEDFRPPAGPDFRRSLRRRRRRLEEEGETSFTVVAGEEAVEELDEFLRLESAGWKGERGTAISASEVTRRFYGQIAHWATGRGWLRVAWVRLDGQPLSGQLFLEEGGRLHFLKTAYDERFSRFGPGHLLKEELVRYAFERGIRRIEMLPPSTEFKRSWAAHAHELGVVEAFSPSAGGAALWGAFRYGRPLVHRVRSALPRSRG